MGPKPQYENPVPGKAGFPRRRGWREGSDRFVYNVRSFQIVPRWGAGEAGVLEGAGGGPMVGGASDKGAQGRARFTLTRGAPGEGPQTRNYLVADLGAGHGPLPSEILRTLI